MVSPELSQVWCPRNSLTQLSRHHQPTRDQGAHRDETEVAVGRRLRQRLVAGRVRTTRQFRAGGWPGGEFRGHHTYLVPTEAARQQVSLPWMSSGDTEFRGQREFRSSGDTILISSPQRLHVSRCHCLGCRNEWTQPRALGSIASAHSEFRLWVGQLSMVSPELPAYGVPGTLGAVKYGVPGTLWCPGTLVSPELPELSASPWPRRRCG
jgi:hypothetical protein